MGAALLVVLIVALAVDQDDPEPTGTAQKGAFAVQLLGDWEMILEYGTAYADPGIAATYDGKPVEAEVQCQLPDFSLLGTYQIQYTATYDGQILKLERTVQVVDTQAPVLTLITIPGHITGVGEAYQDEGCTAVDNYDGDISDRIAAVEEDGVMTYTVTDSSGNTASITRTIVYTDILPPKINLLGEATVTISAGSEYQEPGFTATDDVDGDLTASVVVTGEYDNLAPGSYTRTYTVQDEQGNTATAVRTIVVEPLRNPDTVYPEGKVIYLTFDDGPSQYTPKLLDILAKYNVKATFFVVGSYYLEYLDDIADAGHSIGIHSDTHVYSQIYSSEEAFFKDFYAIREKIHKHTGIWTTLCRFPGGSSNRVSKNYCKGIMTRLTKEVEARGFQYFDWNVVSGDAGDTQSTDQIFKNVTSGIKGRDYTIVLQHDIFDYSINAVERIIQWGLANGYTFLPLDPTSPTAHQKVMN